MMDRSYIVAFTIFNKSGFKTRFEVFSSYNYAFHFYKNLKTENKCFKKKKKKEEIEELKDV